MQIGVQVSVESLAIGKSLCVINKYASDSDTNDLPITLKALEKELLQTWLDNGITKIIKQNRIIKEYSHGVPSKTLLYVIGKNWFANIPDASGLTSNDFNEYICDVCGLIQKIEKR